MRLSQRAKHVLTTVGAIAGVVIASQLMKIKKNKHVGAGMIISKKIPGKKYPAPRPPINLKPVLPKPK